MLGQFTYKRAASIQEAVEAAGRPGARILAGGTDLLGCLRDDVFTAETVVSVSGIQDLKGIGPRPGGGLRIGALDHADGDRRKPPGAGLLPGAGAKLRRQSPARNCATRGPWAETCARGRAAGISAATSIAGARAGRPVSPRPARTSSTPFSGGTGVISSIRRIPHRR